MLFDKDTLQFIQVNGKVVLSNKSTSSITFTMNENNSFLFGKPFNYTVTIPPQGFDYDYVPNSTLGASSARLIFSGPGHNSLLLPINGEYGDIIFVEYGGNGRKIEWQQNATALVSTNYPSVFSSSVEVADFDDSIELNIYQKDDIDF